MNRFIELTSVRHNKKIIVNTSHIATILPSVVGAEIYFGDEDRPLLVREDYTEVKRLLQPGNGGAYEI